jgi:hypothetical protein
MAAECSSNAAGRYQVGGLEHVLRHVAPGSLRVVYAQMGRTDDARRSISTGLSMPNTEKDDSEIKRQGREVLAKLR